VVTGIQSNPRYFLPLMPDVYWPYWFTAGFRGQHLRSDSDTAESSLATVRHTSKRGNLPGNMTQVMAACDVVI